MCFVVIDGVLRRVPGQHLHCPTGSAVFEFWRAVMCQAAVWPHQALPIALRFRWIWSSSIPPNHGLGVLSRPDLEKLETAAPPGSVE